MEEFEKKFTKLRRAETVCPRCTGKSYPCKPLEPMKTEQIFQDDFGVLHLHDTEKNSREYKCTQCRNSNEYDENKCPSCTWTSA